MNVITERLGPPQPGENVCTADVTSFPRQNGAVPTPEGQGTRPDRSQETFNLLGRVITQYPSRQHEIPAVILHTPPPPSFSGGVRYYHSFQAKCLDTSVKSQCMVREVGKLHSAGKRKKKIKHKKQQQICHVTQQWTEGQTGTERMPTAGFPKIASAARLPARKERGSVLTAVAWV